MSCSFSGMTILLSNCFLLFYVMIAFSFVFILSFWHYVCGYNIHLKIIHIIQYCSSSRSQFLSDLELPRAKSFLPLTSRWHTETFCNLAVKIPFNQTNSMTPSNSFLNKVLVRKMFFIQNFLTNYLIPYFLIIKLL